MTAPSLSAIVLAAGLFAAMLAIRYLVRKRFDQSQKTKH